jgi:hypothetical protein
MKSIKIAGLCLVSMFAMSMAFSTSAFAGWEQCTKGVSGVAPTKWTNHLCNEASGTGEWNWREVNGTERVVTKGSLLLKDTKVGGAVSEVECYGEADGVVGPKTFDKVESVTVASCRAIKVCEASKVASAEARNLPWQTELFETEGKKFDSLTQDGNGMPGWAVKCKVAGLPSEDRCTAEGPESQLLENKPTKNGSETELLVLATFKQARKAECSIGGTKAGEVIGSIATLKTNGWGLRVT